MAKEYRNAGPVKELSRSAVIPKWHQHLADVRIAYLFDEEIGMKAGKKVLAKTRKATPVEAHLAGVDVVMTVDSTVWEAITPAQRLALVDHELCHLEKEETDEGDERLVVRGHDLEEFAAVVQRHGLWSADLVWFRDQVAQQKLFGAAGEVTSEALQGAEAVGEVH